MLSIHELDVSIAAVHILRGVSLELPAGSMTGLIGRNALFRPVERPADARAVEPAEVMRLTPSVMSRVLREFPEVAGIVHDGIAEELRDLIQGFSRVGERLKASAPRQR